MYEKNTYYYILSNYRSQDAVVKIVDFRRENLYHWNVCEIKEFNTMLLICTKFNKTRGDQIPTVRCKTMVDLDDHYNISILFLRR